MKKKLIWIIPAVAVIALVIWRFTMTIASNSSFAKQAGSGKATEVQVATPTSRLIQQTLNTVGDVESPIKVEVSPITAGRIDFLNAREGDVVQPGQLLLKVDPSDLQGALVQQQASLAEAKQRLAQAKLTQNATNVGVKSQIQMQKDVLRSDKANLALAQETDAAQVEAAQTQVSSANSGVVNAQAALDKENANLKNDQVTYDRTLNLFKQNFIASQDVDNAKTAVDVEKGSVGVATAQLEAAKAALKGQQDNLSIVQKKVKVDIAAAKGTVAEAESNVRLAEANKSQRPAYQENLNALQSEVSAAAAGVTQAQAKLAGTIMNSTIKGTVTARKADPGDLATPGTPVLEVSFLDWLYVNATVPIDYSTQIHAGQMADITIDGLPGKTYRGPIININPAADPTSRQFGIKVRLDNLNHLVRPGMYGRVTIVTSQVFANVVVPHEAINASSTGSLTVTVVDKSNTAHIVPVKMGVSDQQGQQITSGLSPTDQVVTLTYTKLKEGQKVTISNLSGLAGAATPAKAQTPPTVILRASKVAPKP